MNSELRLRSHSFSNPVLFDLYTKFTRICKSETNSIISSLPDVYQPKKHCATLNDIKPPYKHIRSLSLPTILSSHANSYIEQNSSLANDTVNVVCEPTFEVESLKCQVCSLTEQLQSAQAHLETLLQEKHKWLSLDCTQSNSKDRLQKDITTEKQAIVMKFAQSERLRLKAETRVKELETILSRVGDHNKASKMEQIPVQSACLVQSADTINSRLDEMTKALTGAQEKADRFRLAVLREQGRVSEVNSKLTRALDAHKKEQQRTAGQTETITRMNRELETLRKQLKEADRIREREAGRLCNEVAVCEANERLTRCMTEKKLLQERISQLEPVEEQSFQLELQVKELESERDSLLALSEDLKAVHQRESQLSEFTKRLTQRNAELQANLLTMQARVDEVEGALVASNDSAERATDLAQQAEHELEKEREKFTQSTARLEAEVEELSHSNSLLASTLSTQRAECDSLRRRQHALDRELARQLTHMGQLKSEAAQARSNSLATVSEPDWNKSMPSLTSSKKSSHSGSLEIVSSAPGYGNKFDTELGRTEMEAVDESYPEIHMIEPSKSLLINKIEKLQTYNTRLIEKHDLMHYHIINLKEEIQKKTKLLQYYFLTEFKSNVVTPSTIDNNKFNMIRKGGVMASVFSGKDIDGNISMSFCLEINQKLQSLLEDSLFKHITLKENIDTLGDEVSRLKRVNQELKTLITQTHNLPN